MSFAKQQIVAGTASVRRGAQSRQPLTSMCTCSASRSSRWAGCKFEILGGSDAALQLALGLCDAAGNYFEDWPLDVQEYCGGRAGLQSAAARFDVGTVVAMSATCDDGRAVQLVCQAGPDTYANVTKMIDRTTAAMWSGNSHLVMQFLNAPTEQDLGRGESSKCVWDNVPDDEWTGRGYRVLAMLLMRAGAAFPEDLQSGFVGEMQSLVDGARGGSSNPGHLFVRERILEELKRYDTRGGTSVKLSWQLPKEILERRAKLRKTGSRYGHLSNHDPDAFTVWHEKFLTRTVLPKAERTMLCSSPKLWAIDKAAS
eukprot:COSAG06_NODE_1443_length_9453_cov_5.160145_5_plen_313_part_00